jgi:hypothetical protein
MHAKANWRHNYDHIGNWHGSRSGYWHRADHCGNCNHLPAWWRWIYIRHEHDRKDDLWSIQQLGNRLVHDINE